MRTIKNIEIYTDGGCRPNPGFGAWCAILKYNEHTKILSGYKAQTTNNEMELTACIEAIKAVKEPCVISIYCDSKYVVDAMNSWIIKWRNNNYHTADKKPIQNCALMIELDKLSHFSEHKVIFNHVNGHVGIKYNEMCDNICSDIIKNKDCYTTI